MNVPIITESGCKNCRFSAASQQAGMRECRFGPPTANAIMTAGKNGAVQIAGVVSVFPQMQPDQKCGQYQRGLALDERVKVVS